nr:putative sulfiredoxin isoform X2 [Rhipicephalus microplus]
MPATCKVATNEAMDPSIVGTSAFNLPHNVTHRTKEKNPNTKDQVTPVDILWIKGRDGGNYYYAFGGNHRFEAHYRLGLATIRAKLIPSVPASLLPYLGGSAPDL